jgi:hypothetical protein
VTSEPPAALPSRELAGSGDGGFGPRRVANGLRLSDYLPRFRRSSDGFARTLRIPFGIEDVVSPVAPAGRLEFTAGGEGRTGR